MYKSLLIPALFAGLLGVSAPAHASAKGAPRTHVVASGQRLGSIAKRYNVTIDAICNANDIRERDPIRPGQRLVIPERADKDGSLARSAREATERPTASSKPTMRASLERTSSSAVSPSGAQARKRGGPAWKDYARKPKRKSFVEVHSYNQKWRGLVIDAKGKIRPSARQAIAQLLGATGDHPGVPDRLIRLMVEVSDTFGGRPLHIVSGYRTTSFFRDSRHKTSQAVDFAVVGVPNSAVRDYLLTQSNVGVGYYPNSSFLHLDVRPRATYWVDYAGPGEAPRRKPGRSPTPTQPSLANFDELAEEAAEGKPSAPQGVASQSANDAAPAAPAAPATPSYPAWSEAASSAPTTGGSGTATSPNRSAPRAAAQHP
jgi:LysM repeat protein